MRPWIDWPKWMRKHGIIGDPEKGCWLWIGVRNAAGYGRTAPPHVYAHRRAWVETGRALPPGMVLHHTCEKRACFNPDHLELKERGAHIKAHRDPAPKRSPEDKRAALNAYHRARNAACKALGRCRLCSKPAEPARLLCRHHLDAANASKRRARVLNTTRRTKGESPSDSFLPV